MFGYRNITYFGKITIYWRDRNNSKGLDFICIPYKLKKKRYQSSELPVLSTAQVHLKANRDTKLSTVVLWRETNFST